MASLPLGATRSTPYGSGRSARPLADFLEGVRPKVERILRQYPLSTGQAEEILATTVYTLVWKWETVRNRESWLLAVLARKCRLVSGFQPAECDPVECNPVECNNEQ
jgi:hypothetical protein